MYYRTDVGFRYRLYRLIWTYAGRLSRWAGRRAIAILLTQDKEG